MKREELIKYRGDRTQEEMGRLYGVKQQTWWTWENGIAKPNLATMKRIEIDSGISMEVLFFDAFNNNKLLNTVR